ncbi:NADP-dependent alkenal double bond reductase P2 [Sesamum alatum]|uniref:NADP-dependent alkenal double bond reductase P2 n=1 Tax=Sesamum alatum TaxID=300844 RepID=A0AAE1XPD0_9LAMI|nr:NADP-dependent alkenal double bond reductase P2 [Sesamum alatum]
MEVRNKYIATKNPIDGAPNASDFCICEELISVKLPTAGESNSNDVVVVRNLYVSIDPYQINRMKTHSRSHNVFPTASAVLPGQAIEAGGLGRVVDSGNPDFKAGDVVSGILNWGEYTVVKGGRLLQKLDTSLGFPLSY